MIRMLFLSGLHISALQFSLRTSSGEQSDPGQLPIRRNPKTDCHDNAPRRVARYTYLFSPMKK
jgi:hypothetical protein